MSFSSGRMFLPLIPLNRAEQVPARLKERKTDIFIPENHLEADTFEFRLPEKYPAEFIPDKTVITKPFGEYSLRVSYDEGVLVCQRKRSEEHTSELQSLMRISYAVFCLKKKKKGKTSYVAP